MPRGTLIGTAARNQPAHIARAALEEHCLPGGRRAGSGAERDGTPLEALRVDGGAAVNNLLMQFQADILGVPVVRPQVTETTAARRCVSGGIGDRFLGRSART